MKRCLSDKVLMRLQAGDGSTKQRAHLSVCGACGDRYRSLDRELETVRHVPSVSTDLTDARAQVEQLLQLVRDKAQEEQVPAQMLMDEGRDLLKELL